MKIDKQAYSQCEILLSACKNPHALLCPRAKIICTKHKKYTQELFFSLFPSCV